MSIIISKNGRDAKRIPISPFKDEGYLQRYINDNPESIPLNEIKEDVEVLVLAREFETKSGPIDILMTDKESEIYIIETKLYKNPDKRKVLAQVMDYGAALWKGYSNSDDFINDIDNKISKDYNTSLITKLQQVFKIGEETALEIIENLKNNLSEGFFKFLVLMDKLDDRLKDLILYMNQNSKFDIYSVELKMYKYENLEIVIPKIFGVDIKKDLHAIADTGRYWNEDSFFKTLKEKVNDSRTISIIRDIYEIVEKVSIKDPFYTKSKLGTFNFSIAKGTSTYSLFHIRTDGNIRFFYLNNFKEWRSRLKSVGIETPENKNEYEFSTDDFKDKLDLKKFIELIKNIEKYINLEC